MLTVLLYSKQAVSQDGFVGTIAWGTDVDRYSSAEQRLVVG